MTAPVLINHRRKSTPRETSVSVDTLGATPYLAFKKSRQGKRGRIPQDVSSFYGRPEGIQVQVSPAINNRSHDSMLKTSSIERSP
jgi:hypothetical protein